MTTKSVNLEQRVLHAVHHHFRMYGCSPSYIDIALACGINARHVGRPLNGLTRRGLLTRTPGEPRSIVLAERMANFSDAEIERAAVARGGRVTWSRLPELAGTFLPHVAACGIETDRELAHLVDQLAGDDDGAAHGRQADQAEQDGARGRCRREGCPSGEEGQDPSRGG